MRFRFRGRRRPDTPEASTAARPVGMAGELAQRLDDQGWMVADVLPAPVVDELRSWVGSMLPEPVPMFHASSVHDSRARSREIDQHIKEVLGPSLERILPGYQVFIGAIIAKGASIGAAVPFHQDWTFTDERRDRCVLCWMPLVPTDEDRGAMRVVDGSHRWTDAIRPSGVPHPTEPLQGELGDRAQTLPMVPGQGLVYDPALIHGSWPNQGDERAVIAVALAPAGAPLVHFRAEGDQLVGYEVDEAYFTTEDYESKPSAGAPRSPWAGPVDTAELARRLAVGA